MLYARLTLLLWMGLCFTHFGRSHVLSEPPIDWVISTKLLRYNVIVNEQSLIRYVYRWTHYIAFCALTVVYVWNTQLPSNDIEGIDRSKLMALAEQCQVHLAQATATNSPSRRYSIILEELRSESRKEFISDVHESPQVGLQNIPTQGAAESPAFSAATSMPFTSPSMHQTNVPQTAVPVGARNPFMDWQTSDWLEIDASVSIPRSSRRSGEEVLMHLQAYGVIPGFSLSPNLQWYGGV